MPVPRILAMKRPLTSFLTSAGKVANTLKWSKGSLLALKVERDYVDVALLACPNQSSKIPIADAKTQFAKLLSQQNEIMNNNIQAIIVGWPRQDDGWLGYQCGKVLHVLDSVKVTSKPAVCLFDPHTSVCRDDCWGRNPVYGRITENKTSHVASKEQYASNSLNTIPPIRALDLAEQFCQDHWPERFASNKEVVWGPSSSFDTDDTTSATTSLDDWLSRQQHGQQRSLASA